MSGCGRRCCIGGKQRSHVWIFFWREHTPYVATAESVLMISFCFLCSSFLKLKFKMCALCDTSESVERGGKIWRESRHELCGERFGGNFATDFAAAPSHLPSTGQHRIINHNSKQQSSLAVGRQRLLRMRESSTMIEW